MFTNALRFGTANTDRVTIPTTTDLSDRDPWSIIALAKRTGATGGRVLLGKGVQGTNTQHAHLGYANPDNPRVDLDRATTDLSYIATGGCIYQNLWVWVAATFRSSNASGDLVRLYNAPFGKQFVKLALSTATDGSGAFNSDSAQNLNIGNNSGNNAWQGPIAYVAYAAAELTLEELNEITVSPLAPIRGQLGVWLPGENGTNGLVVDRTGLGRHGVPSGAFATSDGPGLQLLAPPRRAWAVGAAAFNPAWAAGASRILGNGVSL